MCIPFSFIPEGPHDTDAIQLLAFPLPDERMSKLNFWGLTCHHDTGRMIFPVPKDAHIMNLIFFPRQALCSPDCDL